MKYKFSEERGLLCSTKGNSYYVINGAWEGTRNGDEFKIKYGGETLIITDWVDINPHEMSEEWQYQWYFKDRCDDE
jgi:hypothetical protein